MRGASRGNPSRGSAETENTNENEDDVPEWLQDLVENVVDKSAQRIDTLPALHRNYQWSREQKWYRTRVSTKITRSSRRRRSGTVVPIAEIFGD